MPVEIYLENIKTPEELDEEKKDKEKHKHEDNCDECADEGDKKPEPINDVHPLWQKLPSECTDEDYKNFYQKLFHDWKEPLFHIHINADYPLNFKGILYFPLSQS